MVKDALAQAEGLAETADFRTATLVRKSGDKITVNLASILKGDSSEEKVIQPGDTLVIGNAVVSILGAVDNPGTFAMKFGDNLSGIIARAGGLTAKADLNDAYVNRNGNIIQLDLRGLVIDKDQNANIALLPGDIVNIPASRDRVSVFGAVKTPGTVDLIRGELDHLTDAITLAGGTDKDARLDRIKVVRTLENGERKEMLLNLSKGDPASNILLVKGDYIEVPNKKKGLDPSQIGQLGLTLFYLLREVL
jgi:protein involved in polysaccharide export with SLBB domain